MSLFKQLEKLYRPDRFQREDFHTEIVAQVLRNSQTLTLAWLRGIGVTHLGSVDDVKIDTQVKFEKLAEHPTDSRPDIEIRLVAGEKTELILIESKIGSKQHDNQLERYAELLAEKKSEALEKTSLVFITRDYEAARIDKPTDSSFIFRRARWFEFYNCLKAHVNGDGLARELKLFMEENRMSLGNQFRSTDLVAMENFLSAKALMDETLDGEVSEKARKILGSVSNLKKAPNQLRDYQRYIVYSSFEGFECLIGYWFPHENPDVPIWVGVRLYSDPDAPVRKEVIQAFRGWIEKPGGTWLAEQLDDEKAWSSIRNVKAIRSLMVEEDHVQAVKDHLLKLLGEVGQFKQTYHDLPWATSVTEVETEADQ
jgi:hypothetical protein